MLKLDCEELAKTLTACRTLADAEGALDLELDINSKPTKWGLFDGWAGRPASTAGLIPTALLGKPEADEIEAEYGEAYSLGLGLKRSRSTK